MIAFFSKRGGRGFALTELLVVLAVFGLLAAGISSALFLAKKGLAEGNDLAAISHCGQKVLGQLSREIRQAREMVTDLPEADLGEGNPSEIEFEDGHLPSPYQELGSDYYYIRYYLSGGEIRRQYLVYCFEECGVCDDFYAWSAAGVHPCVLEDDAVGVDLTGLEFWGEETVNIRLSLQKGEKTLDFETKVGSRNLR